MRVIKFLFFVMLIMFIVFKNVDKPYAIQNKVLDYDYLIETVQSIIKNDDLLPASIGIYGDWGSGKSNLMYMCKKKQLEHKQ